METLKYNKMSKSKGKQDSISIKRFKNGGVYLKPSNRDMLARYDFGGLLQGLVGGGEGALSGAKMGPWGAIAGGGLGLINGLMSENKTQQQPQPQSIQRQLLPQQQYQPTFAYGGLQQYTVGGETNDPLKKQLNTKKDDILTANRASLLQGGIDNPDIYEDRDAPSKYFTALQGDSTNKANQFTQRFLVNYNNKWAPKTGDSYDPNAANLHMNPNNSWKNIPANAVDTVNTFKPLDWRNPNKYNIQSNPTGQALGGGTFGVGTQKYPMGGNIQQPNAELEQGEQFRTPNGDINQVSNQAPTHQQGGVPLNLPQGTQILGKMKESSTGKEFKELGEKLKKAQDKYNKILESHPTPLAKKTAKMMLDKVQNQYTQLMQQQEAIKKQMPQGQQFAYGGLSQYPLGTDEAGVDNYTWNNPNGTQDYSNPNPTQTFNMSNDNQPSSQSSTIQPQQQFPQTSKSNNFSNIANTLGALAPVGYNLAKGLFGQPKQLNQQDYQNPNTNQINNLMTNRRYDVSPELESNREATSQYYQNLKQASPSQGRYLAGLQTGQIANQRANQDVYSRANNANNQYKAEEAQSLRGLGQEEANTKLGIQDINSRAEAAQRNFLPTTLSQLSQFSQVQQQMSSQKKLDTQKLAIAKEMYKNYPFLKDFFQQFDNK